MNFNLLIAYVVLAVGCGGAGAYRAKCEVSCNRVATTCTMINASQCTNDCDIASAGLSVSCGQCIAENVGFNENSAPSGGTPTCSLTIPTSTGSTCKASCATP